LNVPGSDSSALQTNVSVFQILSIKLHFNPAEKPADRGSPDFDLFNYHRQSFPSLPFLLTHNRRFDDKPHGFNSW
jgi:hypothetical protein